MFPKNVLPNPWIWRSLSLAKRNRSTVATAFSPNISSPVRSYDEIPGPKSLPLIGNAWRFLPFVGTFDMTNFFKWSNSLLNEYGKIVRISNLPGRRDMVLLFDPDMIAEVYKNEGQWPERFVLQSVKQFREKVRPDFFEGFQGLVNENGEKWQQARTVVNQPMMKIDVSNQYIPKSDEVAKDFVKLVKLIRNDKMEMPADFKNEINKWALESISLIALDTRLGCLEPNLAPDSEAQRMIDAVINVFSLSFDLDFKIPFWKFINTPAWKNFVKYEEEVLQISYKYVKQAMSKMGDLNAPETPNMSVLQRILKRDPHVKRAVITGMDIILAGVDTTSNSAAMILYYLAKNPGAQEKLYQEVKSIVPEDPNECITAAHMNKMNYMRACLKESMRLAPVTVGNVRLIDKDITLGNYLIPKNKADLFMFNSTLYLQDEHFPDAKRFIPERWIRSESAQCPVSKKAFETHPYVYKPFGHGVRQCPGMRFANMEMESLVARMLLSFKLEWHQPDVKLVSKSIQGPDSPLKYTLIDRTWRWTKYKKIMIKQEVKMERPCCDSNFQSDMLAKRFLPNLGIWRILSAAQRIHSTGIASYPNVSSSIRLYDEIPGPKSLPLIGNAWRFLPLIGTFDMSNFFKWSNSLLNEYGKIVRISNLPGRRDMVLLFDPDMIAEVYKNEGQWPERFAMQSITYFREKVRPDFFEGFQGLINDFFFNFRNGPKWQEARTVVNQPMMKIEVSNQYIPKSDEVAKDFVKLVKMLRNDKLETPPDFKNEFSKWALESIALIALDTRLGCLEPNLAKGSEAQRMIDAVVAGFDLMFDLEFKIPFWKFMNTPTWKKFVKCEEEILEISHKYVERAMNKMGDLNAPETPEMSVLQRMLKRSPNAKRAVITGMDIILAGVDTTSNSAAMILYYLGKNPDVQEKLYQEVKSVVPEDPNDCITAAHMEKMNYMKACLKESMRLAPVAVGNARLINKDMVLGNYLIPKNKADFFMFNSTLYLQDEYFPEAKQFVPERWIRSESTKCPVSRKAYEINPYVYQPFGHGVRQCPGMRFATMEMASLVARMLLDFKIEWHQPDVKLVSKAVQGPESPLRYTLIDRN
ncbi:uncharacterized protein LOC135943381 [Cloeon dipterum]|uniref:uncharacterized protein LOC135943381 n=1 Tax=Cloeon dipterum TaxID=197152 RepID=UPI0032204D29